MISEKQLEEYYKLKEKKKTIEEKMEVLKKDILEEMGDESVIEGVNYSVEVKFNHEVTQAFVDFLRRTGNNHLIKETSTCDAFKEITERYPLTEFEKDSFCVIKDSPRLFVKKNKVIKSRRKTKE